MHQQKIDNKRLVESFFGFFALFTPPPFFKVLILMLDPHPNQCGCEPPKKWTQTESVLAPRLK